MYKGKDQRKGEVENRIINVLVEVRMGKFKLERVGIDEESLVPALHRAVGGPGYIPFCDMFRALRGLRTILSYFNLGNSSISNSSIFELVKDIIDNAHPMDLHEYHDRRTH